MTKHIVYNVVIVATLFFAYLFLFIGLCYINDAIDDIDAFRLKQIDSVLFEGAINYSEDKVDAKISPSEFRHFTNSNAEILCATIIEKNHYNNPLDGQSFTFLLIDSMFDSFINFDLIEGRFFSQIGRAHV